MQLNEFITHSTPFIQWMLDWQAGLQPLPLTSITAEGADKVGIISVDVINGFCTIGPLASPRVNNIVAPIASLFERAWAAGVRDIALTQDSHPADAVEFAQYAPHCIRGTPEAETVEAFKNLPFFDQISVLQKNSINCGVNTAFLDWLENRPHITSWIVVGDCTDICTYQLAMYLRTRANEQQNFQLQVILPLDCVDTYDLSVEAANTIGATPHNAELLHLVFLHHMMLNGVEVVSEISQ